jgi:hypothetical protein|tara:strand:+ start:1165 stop:6387 length:5223 start_codon:yes stop_codon:yes gene_type:complete
MSLRAVRRNTFYKKEFVTDVFNVNPQFKDLTQANNTTKAGNKFTVGTVLDSNLAYLNGLCADYPDYGSGELVGGFLQLYNSSIDFQDGRSVPEIAGFRTQPDITPVEGQYFLATDSGSIVGSGVGDIVGNRVTAFDSRPVSQIPFAYDSFEGITELNGVTKITGGSITQYVGPYISFEKWPAFLKWAGLEAGDINAGIQSSGIEVMSGTNGVQIGYKIYINKSSGRHSYSIRSKLDEFTFSKKALSSEVEPTSISREFALNIAKALYNTTTGVYGPDVMQTQEEPFYNGTFSLSSAMAEGLIDFESVFAVPATDNSTGPAATTTNTIFNDIYATDVSNNPFFSGPNEPLVSTVTELSTEKSLDGNNSLRMYHTWEHSTIPFSLGDGKNIIPQVLRASIYNIPMPPPPFDVGMDTVSTQLPNTNNVGNMQSVIPEIRMGLNITKLASNLPLRIKQTNSSNPVSGARSFMNSADMANTLFSSYENTFLRSAVVTFSNYKPKPEHTTVDKFMAYGLERFYTGKDTDNIVGGVVFTTFDQSIVDQANIASTTVGSVPDMYAFPLPVTQIKSLVSNTGHTDGKTLLSGGMVRAIGKAADDYPFLDTLTWGVTPVISGATTGSNSLEDTDGYLRFAELPLNGWFDMRCFFDVKQKNNFGTTSKRPYGLDSGPLSNPTMAADADTGIPLRIIFDTHEGPREEGQTLETDTRNLPFLDIFFPVGVGGVEGTNYPTGGANYNFADNPSWFPKHMTIWLQNYPWSEGGSNFAFETTAGDQVRYPSGANMEAEMFIDSVGLYNFAPRIRNFSAQGRNSNMTFESLQHSSPISTMISGTSTVSATPKYFKKAWVQSYAAVSGTAALEVTGTCSLVSGTAIVTIPETSGFDCGTIENLATSTGVDGESPPTIASASEGLSIRGTGIPADTFVNILTANTFQMVGGGAGAAVNSTGDGVTDTYTTDVIFSSFGTLRPGRNKANLYNYNVGQNVALGLNEKTYLPQTTNYSSYANGYLLWNDFSTPNYEEIKTDPILPLKIDNNVNSAIFGKTSGIISVDTGIVSHDINLGAQFDAPSYYVSGTTTGSNISGAQFGLSEGTTVVTLGSNSMGIGTGNSNQFVNNDGFRQKGFISWDVSGTNNGISDWSKREAIACSTKLTEVGGITLNANQIRVDQPTIFNSVDPDETYIIYYVGETKTTASMKTGLKLNSLEPIVGDVISFTEDLHYADNGDRNLITESNLSQLWICPEKYWVTMTFDTPPTRVSRSYSNVCMIQNIPAIATCSGASYNEWQYSYNAPSTTGGRAGYYERTWDLTPSIDNDTFVLDTDFGFGEFDEETSAGGTFIEGPVYVNNYMQYSLNNVMGARKIEPGRNVPLAFYLKDSGTATKSVTFHNNDSTSGKNFQRRPTYYWEFKDEAPVIRNLKITPPIDVNTEDFYDMESQNLNSLTFNWDEDGDDIWYRMLIIDDVPIKDKYSSATAWLPLNESLNDLNSPPTINIYNPTTNASAALGAGVATGVGTDVRTDIDGQGGYAPIFLNSANGYITIPKTVNSGLYNLEAFTLSTHVTFSTGDLGSRAGLVTQAASATASATDNFFMYKDSNDKIVVTIGADIAMTGSAVVPCNSNEPVSIIVTMDKNSSANIKAKLFQNGVLVASSTGETIVAGNNDWYLGGKYAASRPVTTGRIEEFVIYNKALEIVSSANEYLFNSVDLLDIDGTTNKTYNARLIAADYHNFRGSSPRGIGMSNQLSWRPTTV